VADLEIGTRSPLSGGTVDKDQRALVVISSLAPAGRKRLKVLYRALETVSVEMADHMLRPSYGSFAVLAGAKARRDQLTSAVTKAATQDAIRAIDVVVVLHGSPGKLIFDDGNGKGVSVDATAVAADLAPARPKLRMLYSTACYGLSHAQPLVDGGFEAVCGAIGECANGPVEYPQVLSMWSHGHTFRDSVDKGDDPATRVIFDTVAKWSGFPHANSDKEIKGNAAITIDSLPLG
jgi:hypothetical protein